MIMSNFTIIPREDMPTVQDVFEMLSPEKVWGLVFKFPNGTVITNDTGGFDYSEQTIQEIMLDYFKNYHIDAVQMTTKGIITFHFISNPVPMVMQTFWKIVTKRLEETEDKNTVKPTYNIHYGEEKF